MGAPTTSLGAPGSAGDKPGSAGDISGSTWECQRQMVERWRHDWDHHESQSCIQFLFSSMYLCIYTATHLLTVYLDWLQAVHESNSKCAWRWRLSELGNSLRGRGGARLEMQLEIEIQWTLRYSARPWSSGFGDSLGGRGRLNSEMHLEAVTKRDWRCNWRPRLCELRDTLRLRSRDRASWDMHL